jgi:tetratricopeptide (TPR) repeat protein
MTDEPPNASDRKRLSGPVYDAFISYSQRGDKAVAKALRTVIQTIGKPWWRLRNLNVFLDATSLSAAPGLWGTLAEKLDRTRYLILLASPEAAASAWVDKEVAHFIGPDGAGLDRVLIGLTGGDLAWDEAAGDFAWSDATPLPSTLRGRFREEPLWVDLRPFRADPARATKSDPAFLAAALDLAATIKGVEKADLYSEELRQQRRSLRLAYGAAGAIATLAVGAGIAAWVAVERAEEATRNFGIAKDTVDEVIFDIAQGLRDVEGMQVDSLRTILSRVETAVTHLADAAPEDAGVQRSRSVMLDEFGDTYLAAGDSAAALAAYEESLSIARRLAVADPGNAEHRRDIVVRLGGVGDARLRTGDSEGADGAHREMLALARTVAAEQAGDPDAGRDLAVALGKASDMAARRGDAAGARAALDEALALRRSLADAAPGEAGPRRDLSMGLKTAAAMAVEDGDTSRALALHGEAIAIDRALVERDGGNASHLRELALGLQRRGDVSLAVGRHGRCGRGLWRGARRDPTADGHRPAQRSVAARPGRGDREGRRHGARRG